MFFSFTRLSYIKAPQLFSFQSHLPTRKMSVCNCLGIHIIWSSDMYLEYRR